MTHETKTCPICGKPTEAQWRPFCSKRCADIDLHRWLGEVYSLPSNDEPPAPGEPLLEEKDSKEEP